ncbi:ribonuclease E inhibitor RraB [Janibacter limosus]|uniref:Ribonuclease E inhibitor RraB n=1 Tax=Janibacter limosus TaxID=53458 RepID=A0AC61U372_9MICO|nr:ribonuclease E inhibitor RraB [Janibacter limosus]UUZ44470.1 ribonuclease E inhibitor RraB [Janibacter limosus]
MTEHLMVFPDHDDADRIADDLRDEGFTEVRVVREALAGEDDGEDHEWAVHVREDMVADESGAVESGLRERFRALAEEHDGWYDPDPTARG